MKVLVLGVSGMLGSAMFRILSEDQGLEVYGTARSENVRGYFAPNLRPRIVAGIDVLDRSLLDKAFKELRPDVVINCIGLIKQQASVEDTLVAVPINTVLPHRLAWLSETVGARLIHVSTDCVFSGNKGNYSESDQCDAKDLYGKSKFMGELSYPNTITLRTSIIGHELCSAIALVDWFLSQEKACRGFTKAIFSGLPTVEFSRIVRDIVLPRKALSGLYHVAASPITKFDLLRLIATIYAKHITITADDSLQIDRSLNGARFESETGYKAPEWPVLIKTMHSFSK